LVRHSLNVSSPRGSGLRDYGIVDEVTVLKTRLNAKMSETDKACLRVAVSTRWISNLPMYRTLPSTDQSTLPVANGIAS
jgi:hypothetical protein